MKEENCAYKSMSIVGGVPLVGDVFVSGSKNAALPIFAASLLSDDVCVIHNVPQISDVENLASIMMHLCGRDEAVQRQRASQDVSCRGGNTYVMHMRDVMNTQVSPLAKRLRASIVLLGAMLARCQRCILPWPGGCKIGVRPIDMHIDALAQMGATFELDDQKIIARCKKLHGAKISFHKKTVTGSANVIMAASLAAGETLLENVAFEPEICDLLKVLSAMGVEMQRCGQNLQIQGRDSLLSGVEHVLLSDRIECMSYAYAAAATRGHVRLIGRNLISQLPYHERLSCDIDSDGNDIIDITDADALLPDFQAGNCVITAPYPGFPTDLQAQLMAFLCTMPGSFCIRETVWTQRFHHVHELRKMNADIDFDGVDTAHICGGKNRLLASNVYASDLRASFALIIAALVAKGRSTIHDIQHIFRGYSHIQEKLRPLGARVQLHT